MSDLELYIHIPFCIRKCNYCDFLSFPAEEKMIEQYCQALEKEIRRTAKELAGTLNRENIPHFLIMENVTGTAEEITEDITAKERGNFAEEKRMGISSIFIGGGTPSLLSIDQIQSLFACLKECFVLEEDTEISLEANPGTLNKEKLEAYRELGINRLSIGLQSSDNRCLKVLGRIHTWEQFLQNYEQARLAGFSNINIDLMSGLPGQSLSDYIKTLEDVTALNPEHISSYSLILEEGTPFYDSEMIHQQIPDEDTDRKMYEKTKEILGEAGYARYEISNYARPGRECRHNLGYWDGTPYLGFGLGASSYYNCARFSNQKDIERYIRRPYVPFSQREEYFVTKKEDRMEDYMIFGLRKMTGVSVSRFEKEFSVSMEKIYGDVIRRYEMMGLLTGNGDRLKLTDAGIDVSNRIFEDFLL